MAKKVEGDTAVVWVQNTLDRGVKVRARIPNKEDPNQIVTIERVFPRFETDKLTGRVITSGYTELPESEFTQLQKYSGIFKKFLIDKKLIKYDKVPAGATTPAEQVVSLRSEIAKLKADLAEAEKKTESGRVKELEAVIEAQKKKFDALTREYKELETRNAELEGELAALKDNVPIAR
jgi:hypothetical protein